MSEVRKAQIKLNMAKAKEQHQTKLKSMTDRLKNVSSKPMSELNKYTLAQYQIKAAPDLASRSMDQGSGVEGMRTAANRKKIINRVVGIGRAANKLTQKTNEEFVQEDKDLEKVIKDLQAAIQGVKKHVKVMNEDGHQDVASARRKAVLIMEDAAQLLMKLKNMDPDGSLPSWWMNKMAVTSAYMDSMRNYLLVPSEMPSDNMNGMETESYSIPSSDTNVADKYRKKVIPQQVSEKKKKKPKLTPTGPFVSFGTGSYTDSGNGGMGEEVDKEKMKNLDNVMKMYKERKPLKDLVGPQGPGMKRVKAKMDAIPSTDKAGRVSRSRMQNKFGRNINFS